MFASAQKSQSTTPANAGRAEPVLQRESSAEVNPIWQSLALRSTPPVFNEVLNLKRRDTGVGHVFRKESPWPAWHQNVLNDIAKFAGPSDGKPADTKWPAMKSYVCKLSKERAASLQSRLGPDAPGMKAGTDDFAVYVQKKFPANHALLISILGEIAEGKAPAECAPDAEKSKETKETKTTTPAPAEEAPNSRVTEVESFLDEVDPVAGVGNLPAAMVLLRDLPMGSLLVTLRDLRDHFRLEMLREQITSFESPRFQMALRIVDYQGQAALSLKPEEWAELRENILELTPEDQAAIFKFFPPAQVPAEPTPPAGGVTAPSSPAAVSLPAQLLETLWRSYTRRMIGMPGSRKNLDNAFWGGPPADFSAALNELAKQGALATINEIYSRWTGASLTWSVRDIQNTWGGGAPGMNFITTNLSGLRSELESPKAPFCRDGDLSGGAWHWWHDETPCWRETISGKRGLHFCLGSAIPSVHIDPTQVVEKREDDGSCNYDMGEVYQHYKDLGWVP